MAEEVELIGTRLTMLLVGTAICALVGCQSTAGNYQPVNCAMVGSTCSSNP